MIYNLLFLNIFYLLCTIRSQHEIFTTVKVHVTDHMFCQTKLAARVVYEFDLSSLCVVKLMTGTERILNTISIIYLQHHLFLVQSYFIQYTWSHTSSLSVGDVGWLLWICYISDYLENCKLIIESFCFRSYYNNCG